MDCIYIHDLDGRFLNANDADPSLLGYNRGEIGALRCDKERA